MAGGIILVVGVILMLGARIPFLGRLPGDVSINRGNFHFYFPIVTCLIISIIGTVLLNLFFRGR